MSPFKYHRQRTNISTLIFLTKITEKKFSIILNKFFFIKPTHSPFNSSNLFVNNLSCQRIVKTCHHQRFTLLTRGFHAWICLQESLQVHFSIRKEFLIDSYHDCVPLREWNLSRKLCCCCGMKVKLFKRIIAFLLEFNYSRDSFFWEPFQQSWRET